MSDERSVEPAEPTHSVHPTQVTRPHAGLTATTQRDLFRGQGEVNVWSLIRPQTLNPFRAALWCELEPHGRVGRHQQTQYPELVICISGSGEVEVDGRRWLFKPGACVSLALGQTLAISNSSDEPMSYLIVKAEDIAPTGDSNA